MEVAAESTCLRNGSILIERRISYVTDGEEPFFLFEVLNYCCYIPVVMIGTCPCLQHGRAQVMSRWYVETAILRKCAGRCGNGY